MRYLVATVFLVLAPVAHAYVGPGLGLGVIGALFGAIAVVFLAIVGVFWYPLKRILRKRNRGQEHDQDKDKDKNKDEG